MDWTVVVVAALGIFPATIASIAGLVAAVQARAASRRNGHEIERVHSLVNGANERLDRRLIAALDQVAELRAALRMAVNDLDAAKAVLARSQLPPTPPAE